MLKKYVKIWLARIFIRYKPGWSKKKVSEKWRDHNKKKPEKVELTSSCNTIHVSFVNESVISLIDDYLKSVLRSCQMARMELSAKTINSFMTEVPIL